MLLSYKNTFASRAWEIISVVKRTLTMPFTGFGLFSIGHFGFGAFRYTELSVQKPIQARVVGSKMCAS